MPDTRSKTKKANKEVKKKVVKKEAKKAVKKKVTPKFVEGNIKTIGRMRTTNNKDLYAFNVKVINATYEDMYNYVDKIKTRLASQHPDAEMNVQIKYDAISHPISAGFFSVQDNVSLKTPYDYNDAGGSFSEFFIMFTE
jgi:hypothetical protein